MDKGFFGKLFDFSFSEFVTPSIIKVLFWIAIIVSALMTLTYVGAALSQGVGIGLITLVLGLLGWLATVIMARVYLELIIVAFRILGLLRGIAQAKGVDPVVEHAPAMTPPTPPAPPTA